MINRRRFIQASALLIAGTSTLALTGCGSPKTPEDVACAFVRALYRGDAAEATKFFHVPADARDAEVKIAVMSFIIAEAKISESAAQAKDSATKQGGLRDVSIMEPVAKEAVETGKCRARVKVAFGNGSSKVETAQLIKTEKGWLVTFGL